MNRFLLAATLAVAMPVWATPIEATCQRDATDRKLTGQLRADYLRQCRSDQGMSAAVNICERYFANKPAMDSFQKQHIMGLCMLEYLHPGNGPYTPPGRIPEKNYKVQ